MYPMLDATNASGLKASLAALRAMIRPTLLIEPRLCRSTTLN